MKNLQKFLNLFLSLVIIVILSSCEEKIDLKLDSSYNRLVVDGEISSEIKQHQVKLSISTSYFYNESAPPAKGAIVSINDDQGNTYPLTETPSNSGIYLTAPGVQGFPGRLYTLKISNLDINGDGKEESYEAQCLMKTAMIVDSITFSKVEGRPGFNKSNCAINGWGYDPPTAGDYYMWKYLKNGKLETDTLKETTFQSDMIFNGKYIPGVTMFEINAQENDTIEVESIGITKEYYEYVVSFMLETVWVSGSFSGPPANIKTNISNGGLGFFNAVDIKRTSNIIRNLN